MVDAATDFAERLEIFFGEASDTVCHVYARLRGPEVGEGLQLSGTLVGPNCAYAQTLPARYAFKDRGPGASLLAGAVVPEPCFWTPDMPHLYQADMQLRKGDEVLARATRSVGLRTLGAAGRDLIYDGKRWVLRGVTCDEVPTTELGQWRQSDAALFVRDPSDALCEQASRIGVLVVAELEPHEARQIRRLSRWPAVGIVVLSEGALDFDGLPPNLLLAERFAAGQPAVPSKWAHLALCEVGWPAEAGPRIADTHLPTIAIRSAGPLAGVAAGRTACDRLQRDLATHGEWAGYIV